MTSASRVVVIFTALVGIAAAPDDMRATPLGSSHDELILLPSSDQHSPQEVQGEPYLPLVAACAEADHRKVRTRRSKVAVWEYAPGIRIAAPSAADQFIAGADRAQAGANERYTLVMILGEERSAPTGQYTNHALVYSSTFSYCLFDMPERSMAGKGSFTAHPPDAIGMLSNSYTELRRAFAGFIDRLPVAP